MTKWASALAALCLSTAVVAAPCQGTLYLTLDTGSMSAAQTIAEVLQRHHVLATFFIANEPTWRGDHALDDAWGDYWRARVREGHHFGSHTWHHGTLRRDLPDGRILSVGSDGVARPLDQNAFCEELSRVNTRFIALTGRTLDPLWRAPGGHTTAQSLAWAPQCGFTRHVGWAPAGFLGDELPSETHPNAALLQHALHNLKDGDILMMHLGIRSRHDPFVAVFEPLISGLEARGFCFAVLP